MILTRTSSVRADKPQGPSEQRGGKHDCFLHTSLSLERKRADRLEIARRLYQALVAQDPDQVITLCDGGGRVVARHEPRPELDAPEIAS